MIKKRVFWTRAKYFCIYSTTILTIVVVCFFLHYLMVLFFYFGSIYLKKMVALRICFYFLFRQPPFFFKTEINCFRLWFISYLVHPFLALFLHTVAAHIFAFNILKPLKYTFLLVCFYLLLNFFFNN